MSELIVKGITDEDCVNYKKNSMCIIFSKCDFKCEAECGMKCCQNDPLLLEPDIKTSTEALVRRYLNNDISEAVVMAGLEPFFNPREVIDFVEEFRKYTNDDVVIYTGYKEDELEKEITELKKYPNIYIKFGRYIPNQESHFDAVLGVPLASPNQYCKKIS